MKKIVIALWLAAATGLWSYAQQISVGYGGYTQMDAINCHHGFSKVDCAWGALNASIYLPLSSCVKLGASYTFSSASTPDAIAEATPDVGVRASDDARRGKVAYHVVMLNTKVEWWHGKVVTLYTHTGVGAIISHMQPPFVKDYNKGYFAFQISPLGAEVGIGKRAAMFAELGFGAQGLAQVGLSYGF